MTELSALLPALAAGLALGAMYFAGLWWTVGRGIGSPFPARWFLLSLLARTGVAMIGFYLVGRGSWQRLLVCLLGFIIARYIVTRLTVHATAQPSGSANHAP
jgi:F1F0 ATPase subunit 2